MKRSTKIFRTRFPPTCSSNNNRGTVQLLHMAAPRDVSHPILRTYLTKTTSASGKPKFHVRLYAPEHNLDQRGTGRTVQQAASKARRSVRTKAS